MQTWSSHALSFPIYASINQANYTIAHLVAAIYMSPANNKRQHLHKISPFECAPCKGSAATSSHAARNPGYCLLLPYFSGGASINNKYCVEIKSGHVFCRPHSSRISRNIIYFTRDSHIP